MQNVCKHKNAIHGLLVLHVLITGSCCWLIIMCWRAQAIACSPNF